MLRISGWFARKQRNGNDMMLALKAEVVQSGEGNRCETGSRMESGWGQIGSRFPDNRKDIEEQQ